MKQMSALLIGICLLLGLAGPVQSYEDDMHYYMIYWMSGQIGFDREARAKFALSNLTTDTSSKTEPMAEKNPYKDSANERRRNWHFPGLLHKEGRVFKTRYYEDARQNSYYGLYNTLTAMGQSQKGHAAAVNPYYMGMSLHSYMDTYAHEGFGARFGHAKAGFDPDRPHIPEDKTKKMLDRTFTQLVNYAKVSDEVPGYKIQAAIKNKAAILDKAWKIIHAYDTSIDNDWDTYKRSLISESRHNSVMNMRFKKWKDAGVDMTPKAAKTALNWSEKTWENHALANYKLPWKVTEVSGMDKLPMPFAANSFDMPDTLRYQQEFALDYCDVSAAVSSRDDRNNIIYNLYKDVPQIFVYSRYYPEEYAQQIQCATQLVRTRDGLETLMRFVEDDGSGLFQAERNYTAIQLINVLAWEPVDMEAVVLPYLDSRHKDARIIAAWAAHQYGIENPRILADIFEDARRQERSANSGDDTLEGEGRVIDLLPMTKDYVRIWEQFFRYGEPDETAKAAFALYTIGTARPAPPQAANAAGSAANSVNPIDIMEIAIKIIQAGSGKNGPEDDAVAYWQIRSYEDIDDHIHNSSIDDRQIKRLIRLVEDAVASKNHEQIIAAAIAASTYSPEDDVDMALVEALAGAMNINDPVVRSEVGYAIQQISGKTFDLTKDGLATLDTEIQAWMREKF